jgi:hypothetical protein
MRVAEHPALTTKMKTSRKSMQDREKHTFQDKVSPGKLTPMITAMTTPSGLNMATKTGPFFLIAHNFHPI